MKSLLCVLVILAFSAPAAAGDPSAWTLLDKAIMGPMRPASLVHIPTDKRWMTLGYFYAPGSGPRKPRTYDDLSLDEKTGQWENWYPEGKDWGPRFGDSSPPAFKGEKNFFKDNDGNVRPHWSAWYWLLGNGHNYAWDPDSKSVLFYIDGQTFRYDPATRQWHDLKAPGDPQTTFKSRTLLWGSVCYDQANKNLVLFGGGNAMTDRGDPGTWTYSLSKNTWTQLSPAVQPPARANSSLAYDPVSKKVVLFGGDQLNQLLADTWVFDGKTWEQKKPKLSPSPRGGHALVWLPKSQKILLVGGYGYDSGTGYYASLYKSLPLEAWTYDVKADRWDLVHRIEPGTDKKAVPHGPQSPVNFSLHADVDANDHVLLVDARRQTWKYAGGFTADEAATQKHGVSSGTTVRRAGPYDPKWYDDVPPADPAKVEADLKDLPVNRWVLRPTPKLPRPNTDWGTAAYATHSGKILRFSGGHSAYSGTAPFVYDTRTDRWSLPFAPEFPLHISYSNDGVPGDWSFAGNPWMTGHTYKSLGYDPNLKALVFGPHKFTYFFEPGAARWTRSTEPNPYQPNFYTTTLIPTPKGLICWSTGKDPLWRLDADTKTWKPLPVQGKFPIPVCDNAGMAYDSKRDRLLAFAWVGKDDTTTHAYDFATGVATRLDPPGGDTIQAQWRDTDGKKHFEFREAVYLPEHDVMLIGATGFLYNCARDSWSRAAIPSDAPDLTKHPSYNLGVMADPARKLVWAVDTDSRVYVLRLDPTRLK